MTCFLKSSLFILLACWALFHGYGSTPLSAATVDADNDSTDIDPNLTQPTFDNGRKIWQTAPRQAKTLQSEEAPPLSERQANLMKKLFQSSSLNVTLDATPQQSAKVLPEAADPVPVSSKSADPKTGDPDQKPLAQRKTEPLESKRDSFSQGPDSVELLPIQGHEPQPEPNSEPAPPTTLESGESTESVALAPLFWIGVGLAAAIALAMVAFVLCRLKSGCVRSPQTVDNRGPRTRTAAATMQLVSHGLRRTAEPGSPSQNHDQDATRRAA